MNIMDGKEKCEYLKKLRKEIADRNGIDYNPASCTNEGPCAGTCPTCDKEAADLMAELRNKEKSGDLINADVDNISLKKELSLTNADDTDDVVIKISPEDLSPDDMVVVHTMGDIDVGEDDIILDMQEPDILVDLDLLAPDYMEESDLCDLIDNEESDEKP